MRIGDILIIAVVGLLVVFTVLVILMCAIKIMAFIFQKLDKSPNKSDDKKSENTIEKTVAPAPGSCGGVVLKNVSDKDAAMIMAIVADKLETPLNELRFISIKESEEN